MSYINKAVEKDIEFDYDPVEEYTKVRDLNIK